MFNAIKKDIRFSRERETNINRGLFEINCFINPLTIVLITINLSCNSPNSDLEICHSKNEIIQYQIEDINIPIDGTSYDFRSSDIILVGSDLLLYALDPFRMQIAVYNLSECRFDHNITLSSSGPNEVYEPDALTVKSINDIYIMGNEFKSILYHLDSLGFVKSKWAFDSDMVSSNDIGEDEGARISTSFSTMGEAAQEFFITSDYKLIAHLDFGSFNEDTYRKQYSRPYLATYSLLSNRIVELVGKYPSEYQVTGEIPHDPFIRFSEPKLVSFSSSNWLYDIAQDSFFCMKSTYWNNKVSKFMVRSNNNIALETSSFDIDDKYVGFYYDPLLFLHYRIFKQFNADENKSRLQSNWSVLILNREGEIFETALIDGGQYYIDDINVVPGIGLLVSRENFENSLNAEEELNYSILKFDYENL
ncbi:MAG: hypothetical protein ACI9YE_001493 [Psychroserpens sp.]